MLNEGAFFPPTAAVPRNRGDPPGCPSHPPTLPMQCREHLLQASIGPDWREGCLSPLGRRSVEATGSPWLTSLRLSQ